MFNITIDCIDSNDGARNSNNDTCDYYYGWGVGHHRHYECNWYDDDDSSSGVIDNSAISDP